VQPGKYAGYYKIFQLPAACPKLKQGIPELSLMLCTHFQTSLTTLQNWSNSIPFIKFVSIQSPSNTHRNGYETLSIAFKTPTKRVQTVSTKIVQQPKGVHFCSFDERCKTVLLMLVMVFDR